MPKYPVIERINPDLKELLDRFFEVSRRDLEEMLGAIDVRDFEALARLGHTAKGTGSGYGFKGMGHIGRGIETAANARNLDDVREQVDHLARYLDIVTVEFENDPDT